MSDSGCGARSPATPPVPLAPPAPPWPRSRPGTARTRSRTLPAPTCFDKEIFEVVSDLLRQNVGQGRAVRLLGVSASALQTTGWQESLFNRDKRKSFAELYKGIDKLRRKYGEDAIGAATPRHRSG